MSSSRHGALLSAAGRPRSASYCALPGERWLQGLRAALRCHGHDVSYAAHRRHGHEVSFGEAREWRKSGMVLRFSSTSWVERVRLLPRIAAGVSVRYSFSLARTVA